MQQMLRREKAILLFMQEGAGERNEKKTAQGAAGQKPFLLSVTCLGALLSYAPVSAGMKSLISVLLGVLSMAMVDRSLWSVRVPKFLKSLFWVPDVRGL